MINLKLLPEIKQYTSVHHVSSYCPDPDEMRTVNHVRNSLVRVHHYLGTPEQYFFRDDPRILDGKPKMEDTGNATVDEETLDPMAHVDKNPKTYHKRSMSRYTALDKKAVFPDPVARSVAVAAPSGCPRPRSTSRCRDDAHAATRRPARSVWRPAWAR